MATYGRNRQSVIDIEEQLRNIIEDHPASETNDQGEPSIPADNLYDVFSAYSELANVQLISDDEQSMFQTFLSANPDLRVTPSLLVQYIAEKTKHSPGLSPQSSPNASEEEEVRGRLEIREDELQSRSSSNDSSGTSVWLSQSRSASREPPQTPKVSSPFDTSKRQRSTPLRQSAPSSWSTTRRPRPAGRRKSDAGSRSDSDSFSSGPSAYGNRPPSRNQGPSDPTSPSSGITSPPFSRPHSRAKSQPQSHFSSANFRSGHREMSPDPTEDDDVTYGYGSPGQHEEQFRQSISSLSMPRMADSDSDEDNDSAMGLVMDRSTASSTVSMDEAERLEALGRTNQELQRRLADADRTLQNKLTQHETEVEELQVRLDEVSGELAAAKREEKELRSKERQHLHQIAALESDVSKITKALDNSRTTYASLQKQYQEQIATSEKYRDELREREDLVRSLRESGSLYEIEASKWAKEADAFLDRIASLEQDLSIAQQAHEQLDEQKRENMLLKETIDRMRFDMDEMRSNAASGIGVTNSGQSSRANTISKSLGAELMGKMKGWGMEDEEDEESEEEDPQDDDGDETEGEDVIQTIITRKKRKVASRAQKIETVTYEETKEYSDASIQYEGPASVNSAVQTLPEPKVIKASFEVQTDLAPTTSVSAQTDVEESPPPRAMAEMEIQTDTVEEPVRPKTPEESFASSSSSTATPPTPTPKIKEEPPHDQPPAYNQITSQEQEEHDWRVAADTLKKWHRGVKIPFQSIEEGVSEDAIEEWKALKEELGIECNVIDKILAESTKTGQPRKDGKRSGKRGGRFYNIYNTYRVYGNRRSSSGEGSPLFTLPQLALCFGISAAVFAAMSPYMIQHYSIPGGPTYYDRTAWSSFNSMQASGEGFSSDGTAAVWNFLGRVGGGAARVARGWPT